MSRIPTLIAGLLLWGVAPPAMSQDIPDMEREGPPTIEVKTGGMDHLEGFFDLYWDEREGKLYWEIDRWESEFLYQVSLASGIGSNPVGLDRGQLGGTHLLVARRVGPTVLLVEPNYRYRALSSDPDEVRAVTDAFAPSTHWGFTVEAETDDRVLVNATDFFLRDAHGVARRLDARGQGGYQLARSRSVLHMPRTRSFPRNTEVEASLTFTTRDPGQLVSSTAPSGEAITVRQHHSLVRLPEPGYTPRKTDPRIGVIGMRFNDYATPIDQPLTNRWAVRYRLEKRDPSADRSEPIEPIVYYLDRGTPEPVRSALIEGGAWWNEAFEEAGFIDALRVEVLPEGADPQDVRYNMIHWTHRSTRGWSYGNSVVDPRSGEILKGNVNLGSLRLRQDNLLGLGLAPPIGSSLSGCDMCDGPGFGYLAKVGAGATPAEMALARVRQLSAHEVGHTLGFPHNYIASTYGRASVMDYPAPTVRIAPDGTIDLSDAYAVGIGEYDKLSVKWLYSDFASGTDEEEALEAIVHDGLTRGMRYLTDQDARPDGAAHPLAALWDNGADPIATLRHEIEVRRIGLDTFGEPVVGPGEPLASAEEVLVPLYLHHRYQLKAAIHSIGGADYSFALRGDGQTPVVVVPGARQREALGAALETLSPSFLAIPERVLALIPPRAYGMASGETFANRTNPTLDPLGAAAVAADFTVSLLLQPERMARLVEFHSRSQEYPGLPEVTDALFAATWYAPVPANTYHAAVQRVAQRALLDRLIEQAGFKGNTPAVRAVLSAKIAELGAWLEEHTEESAHNALALEDILRWQDRPEGITAPSEVPERPAGQPIGG